jgi:hypothetical protein
MKDKISKVFDIEPIEQEGFKVKNMFVDISKDTPQDD